jgi:hypothetical protein
MTPVMENSAGKLTTAELRTIAVYSKPVPADDAQ